MYVLGIHCYGHDAAAALVKDGEIVASIEQERLDRKKHSSDFPAEAIAACLEIGGIRLQDVQAITYAYNPTLELFGNLLHVLRFFPASLNLVRASAGTTDSTFRSRLFLRRRITGEFERVFPGRIPPVVMVEHHLGHAASAFFVSPFDEAAILTMDGRGESTCTLLAHGRGNRIVKLREHHVPHSIGHLYSAITAHLGFVPFIDEWKVMGMAAYGSDRFVRDFDDVLQLHPDGGYALNVDFFGFHTHGRERWVSERFVATFGSARAADQPIEPRHFDLAFALQRATERVGVHVARHLHAITGARQLCLAGGVVLNVLMNKRIIEETPFERVFIQPIAHDAGNALGGALFHTHRTLGLPRRTVFCSPYLGPEYSDAAIRAALEQAGVAYQRVDDAPAQAAKLVAEGNVVGWFQGRMEAGPRALGNRSILGDPRDPGMKDRLNARVKRRESFRPFAPSVLEERAGDCFLMPRGQTSPYMIVAADVRPEMRSRIPAVVHADGTARVHTVNRQVNPRYWELIAAFDRLTGVPVVLNTSFNENEPIVCAPREAVACLQRTDLDALVIGDYVARKPPSASSSR